MKSEGISVLLMTQTMTMQDDLQESRLSKTDCAGVYLLMRCPVSEISVVTGGRGKASAAAVHQLSTETIYSRDNLLLLLLSQNRSSFSCIC